MKTCILSLLLILTGLATESLSQHLRFRSGIFLHHSTGECIWGPNGGNTSVPQEMAKYNTTHGWSGEDAVTMDEEWWPNADDNEWSTWHEIFNNISSVDDIRPIIRDNRIVVIKSCFPSSSIWGTGNPDDTLDPTSKSIYNYKWHWRSIIKVMARHPDNFFVIWTNAPLVANETDDAEAQLAIEFCRWAKDTLPSGMDPVIGMMPSNVYVFDFFGKLAGKDGKLPPQYATDVYDSHPNGAATDLVAPQFVTEIFDAAIAYETLLGVREPPLGSFQLEQNYPNPFGASSPSGSTGTTIEYHIPYRTRVIMKVFDVFGRENATLVDEMREAGVHEVVFQPPQLKAGLFFYYLQAGELTQVRKMMLRR